MHNPPILSVLDQGNRAMTNTDKCTVPTYIKRSHALPDLHELLGEVAEEVPSSLPLTRLDLRQDVPAAVRVLQWFSPTFITHGPVKARYSVHHTSTQQRQLQKACLASGVLKICSTLYPFPTGTGPCLRCSLQKSVPITSQHRGSELRCPSRPCE